MSDIHLFVIWVFCTLAFAASVDVLVAAVKAVWSRFRRNKHKHHVIL